MWKVLGMSEWIEPRGIKPTGAPSRRGANGNELPNKPGLSELTDKSPKMS